MGVQSDLTGDAQIPEDKIFCKVTDSLRSDNEHERNRRRLSEELHGEYGYTYDQMDIEYTVKAGSESRDVDLVVFDQEGTRRQEDIRVVAEIEPEETAPDDPDHGVGQAKSYMRLAPAEFGIWYNGEEHFYFHQADGKITEVKDVPPHGATLEDIEERDFDQLTPAVELKTEFKRCHNYIASNQGLSKTDAFHELLKIIFCKAHDERHSSRVRFYVTDDERRSNPDACKRRISSLFQEVKDEHPDIFGDEAQINFEPDVLAFVVAELEPYLLLDTDSDIKGEAYETIVGSNLRGDRGEFFTPRNVCQAGVQMAFHMKPERDWASLDVIDPACGTGGFLISVIEYMKRQFIEQQEKKWNDPEKARRRAMDLLQTYCENHVYGMDLNPQLVRAAQMNEVMHGNGHRNPFPANSLVYPDSWEDDNVELGMFDLLFTNPPFGSNMSVDEKDVLRQYDLAHRWDGTTKKSEYRKSVPPQQLFIERSVQLLKPGGVAAIVTPDSILTNPSEKFIRHWLLKHTKVVASIGLPRETFLPYTPTKTHLMLVEKRDSPIDNPSLSGHEAFMASAEKIGTDKRGEPIHLRTPEGDKIVDGGGDPIVDDDLPSVVQAFKGWYK
ncbi:restriction endonuclease subunit M [Halobacterium zhouii]|uniref:restriction endonuclease subunit M n=1 Tax=Halobacterium zhouii TaxID=2902624 RepID=UPI001E3931DF|nr:N-6 DNA methylase [Halobacterium zhouii]